MKGKQAQVSPVRALPAKRTEMEPESGPTPLLDYTRFQQPGLHRKKKKLTMQQQRRGGLAVLGEGVQIAVGPLRRAALCCVLS